MINVPLISLQEIIDVIIITAALGYIFSGMFDRFRPRPEDQYGIPRYSKGFDWQSLKFAAMITAPAVILHELGHKFAAVSLGAGATFHAAYMWLGIGIVLKLMNTGFIFFVPAFVSHTPVTQLQSSIIAFAGPAVNLALWLGSMILLKTKIMRISKRYSPFVFLSGKINMFLFIFNMLPIPGFDGYWVLKGVISGFF